MGTRESPKERGHRRASRLLQQVATELRDARRAAGVSQAFVARTAGLTQSHVSRVERAARTSPRVDELARHAAALGTRISLKVYPEGEPVRDAGQLRLLRRFRARLPDTIAWRSEVPVGGYGDLRAWDVVLDADLGVAVDAETRLHDIQALQRRCETKWRDSELDRVVLLVAATPHNRAVLREHRLALASTFPLDTAAVMRALTAGVAPPKNGIVVL
jgi:transcriptional regulator with XRE-family HTH domain